MSFSRPIRWYQSHAYAGWYFLVKRLKRIYERIYNIIKLFWRSNKFFFFSRWRNIFNTPVEFSKYITATTEGNSANL